MNITANATAMITGIFPTLPGAGKGHPFELRAGPFFGGELQVVSLRGRERMNDVYRYDVIFATDAPADVVTNSIFGSAACLNMKSPGHDPRVIQGIVASVEAIGAVPGEQTSSRRRYELSIVPRLWLLKHRRRHRIWQHKSVPEIVDDVLGDAGIKPVDCRWRADRTKYPKLPFVYQRGETDFDLFRRVLASAGIFFFYEHANGFLDSMFGPGASTVAGAVGAAAGMLGGAVGNAIDAIESATGMVPVLNFGSDPGHTAGVTSALGALAADALHEGLGALGGAIGGAAGGVMGAVAGAIEEPSDTLPFDDGIGAEADVERVYEFALRKELRTKQLRMLDRDVEGARNWVGVATVADVELDVSAGLSIGPKGLSAHVNASFDLDAPSITPATLRQEVYQADMSVQQDSQRSIKAAPGSSTSLSASPAGLLGTAQAAVGAAKAAVGAAKPAPPNDDGAQESKRLKLELDRVRRKYQQAAGRSDCRRLGAGYRFTLGGHPIDMLNGEYTVTSLDVEGVHPDFTREGQAVYRNRFRCIPSTVAALPKRPKQRPKPGMEVARVVGFHGGEKVPALEANHVGYVRVRFYWDVVNDHGVPAGSLATGTDDVHAVWIPIVQPWAGQGYGAQFIPREGMDVLVGFMEDQSERPIVLGCVHSAANPPPWAAYVDHQKVGIRSQSRPHDGGYSEMSIDDRQGGEVVKVRAQRDLNVEAVRDSFTHVRRDARTTVDGNSHDRVFQNARFDVTKDATTTVGRNEVTEVKGDSSRLVVGDRTSTVQGSERRHVQHDLSTVVSGRADIVTQGQHHESFEDDAFARHDGHRVVLVGDSTTKRSTVLHVEGAARAYASSTMEAVAVDSLTITCGQSQICMTPKAITLSSPKIVLATADAEIASTKKVVVTAQDSLSLGGGKVSMSSSGASVALDSNATVQGSKVQLGGGSGAAAQADKAKVKVTKLTLADQDGNPVPEQRMILRRGGEGGEERMVVLDADASINMTGDDPFDVRFPDLPDAGKGAVRPPQKKPGDPKPLVIAQGDHLSKLAFRHGFDPDAVWNDPKNADIKKKRSNPNMLLPGDVLMVPENKPSWVSASIGSSNAFVATVPRVPVSVKFVKDGKPLANEPYYLQGLKPKPGDPNPAMTDGDGCIKIEVPMTVTSFGVYFETLAEVHHVRVGHMDPPDTPTGARMRLGLLGILGRPGGKAQIEGPSQELLYALAAFQSMNDLKVTGQLDNETVAKLVESFGH